MKRTLSALMLTMFSLAIIGCEAKVGNPDGMDTSTRSRSSYEKKTTTVSPDGDTTTKTEMKRSN